MHPDRCDQEPVTGSNRHAAVMGGTGPQGKGLGYRFARHGHDGGRGLAGRREGRRRPPRRSATGWPAWTAPVRSPGRRTPTPASRPTWSCSRSRTTATTSWSPRCPLAGKTVVSCVNPLAFDKRGAHGQVIDGGEGSAAESRPAPGAGRDRGRRLPQRVRGAAVGRRGVPRRGRARASATSVEAKQVAMDLARCGGRPRGHRRRQAAAGPSARAVHRRADLDQPEVQGALRHPDHGDPRVARQRRSCSACRTAPAWPSAARRRRR